VDMESGWPLFIRDRFDETFQLRGGGSERRSGFTLIFFEGSLPLDRTAAASAIVGGIASVEGQRSPPSAPGPAGGLGTAAPISSGTAAPSSSGTAAPGGPAGGPGTAAPSGSSLAAPGSESSAGPQSAGAGPLPAGSGLVAPGSESSAGPQPAGAGPLPAGAGPGPLVSGAQDRILEDAGVELAQSEAGIVLRVRDLHFIADSDQILPSDLWRLDAIAAALKALPGRNFLVEGYSASVGNPAGELGLSQKRAKRVADELAGRGIEAGRFLYKGWGSSRPLASNDTEAGRAENRRVEITVLD
ncbi:MAG TPA: OmpA family protein, partial [Rectinemataceae bacterium]|nr:OmpA family protein [Rectinemataceae bacterium]